MNFLLRFTWLSLLGLVGWTSLAFSPVHAEEGRWLLVVETSSATKNRVPAMETEIRTLLVSEFSGNIHPGDSLAVWSYGDKLQAGKFPLTTWGTEPVATTLTNLLWYVDRQTYSGAAKLSILPAKLDQVIADSERLTVVIFCSGTDEIHWTPYDTGLNDMLKQMAADRLKQQQPFLVVLRTQRGKYVGATISFPPQPITFPAFPLLPGELPAGPAGATALPKATNLPAVVIPKALPPAAPLLIVGKSVTTNVNDLLVPPAVPVAPIPVPSVPVIALERTLETTNYQTITNLVTTTVVVTQTVVGVTEPVKPVASPQVSTAEISSSAPTTVPAENKPDHVTGLLLAIGVGLLVVAAGVGILLIRVLRPPQTSLITSTLERTGPPTIKK